MVFKIPELAEGEFFDVEYKGVVYHLPKLQNVSLDAIESIEGLLADTSQMTLGDIRTIVNALDEDFAKVAGTMSAGQLRALLEEWQTESSVGLGESEASADS